MAFLILVLHKEKKRKASNAKASLFSIGYFYCFSKKIDEIMNAHVKIIMFPNLYPLFHYENENEKKKNIYILKDFKSMRAYFTHHFHQFDFVYENLEVCC